MNRPDIVEMCASVSRMLTILQVKGFLNHTSMIYDQSKIDEVTANLSDLLGKLIDLKRISNKERAAFDLTTFVRVGGISNFDYAAMSRWCDELASGRFTSGTDGDGVWFVFVSEPDSILFRLAWSEKFSVDGETGSR